MNKLETKQKKKEKKKESRITKALIRERLLKHFKNHIGEQNKTTQEEIFQISTGFNSLEFDGFKRFYIWETINKEIKKLRKENKCFIIKKKGSFFVLKEQNEADYYKNTCDRAIIGMKKAKLRADIWVEDESWKKLGDETYLNEEPKEEKEINDNDRIIDINQLNEKAKTKIIRLFKEDETNNK